MPVYDRTDQLREAIDSVLAQTFRRFELVIVCDGSPEETIKVVQSYADNERVKTFFFPDNSGNPCRGRNKGIEIAAGHYVAFLDSDDIAMPDRLEKSAYYLKKKKVDIVGGAIQYLTEGASIRGFENGSIGFTGEECSYELLRKGNRLSICTVAVRKKCLERFGGFREEMRYREDHELWLRLAYHGCTFYNAPDVFAQYRVHENNAEQLYLENDQHWQDMVEEYHKKPFSN